MREREKEREGESERERIFVSKRRSHRRSHGVTSIALPRKRDSDVRGEEVHAKHARTGRTTTTETVGKTPKQTERHTGH